MLISETMFLGAVFFVFAAFDLVMLISLLKMGDERSQIIVGKASSFTLLAVVGSKIFYVAENFVKAQPMTANPLVQLETAAIIYFAALMYYKKRLGG
ncbi:MAG: hypothetical protein HFH30_00360 [Eubacterium sp.]|nr:hypothetical protein [Eubacterium sp.]MCI8918573.1 hypothetical protein [Eubacterium sp.]